MADTKDTGEKTLRVAPSKTLTIKRSVEQGVVRQSFSHGRTKSVVVEKVKRRVVGAGAEAKAEAAPAKAPASRAAAPAEVRRPRRRRAPKPPLPRRKRRRSLPASCCAR
jgi:translation initiation factor IF-2